MLFWAWSCLVAVQAQHPFFRAHAFPEEYRQVQVREMLQSRTGYIWLGAGEGLFRFDGETMTPVVISTSILPFSVSALYEDADGLLWVGLQNGQVYTLDVSDRPKLWEPEEGHPAAPIVAFAEDGNGHFWIATYGEGLYCWKNNRLFNFATEDGMGGNEIYDMGVDHLGQVWCGTDRGLNLVGWENDRKTVRRFGREEGLPDEIVRLILPDERCGIWVGMHEGGLCRIDPASGRVDHVLPAWEHGIVTALACFHQREVWIGTDRQGLFRLDLPTGRLKRIAAPGKQPGPKVHALLRDDEGGVWVSSNTPGIFSANRRFQFLPSTPGNIQAILADQEGGVWAGAQEGLFRKTVLRDSFVRELPWLDLNVVSLYEDGFGNIWIGTFGQGVYGYKPQTGKLLFIPEGPLLANGSVLSMDGLDSTLWLATLGGATQWTFRGDPLANGSLHSRPPDEKARMGANYIYRVFVDSQRRTWFCTDGEGLYLLENDSLRHFTRADTVPLKAVYSIAEDGQGTIWVSTSDRGLFAFDGKDFSALSLKEGIRDLSIAGIAATARGEILIVHQSGVDLLDPLTGHLIYFGEEVGIPDLEPSLNALDADPLGNIWIGLPDRVLQFTSLDDSLRIHPKTRLVQVSVLLDPIPWWERKVFSYRENFLVFDYAGIWLTDPQSVTYRYQLEGFDRDWIQARDRRATYSNLPPGQYTFRVASTENGAFNGEPVIAYSFRVRSPWWLNPWFILAAGAGLAALLYSFIRNREQRLQRMEKLKQESIQSQYEALKSQINPHFLFNSFNTLIAFIEENPALAVEYVEKLSDFYRVILAYREKERISLGEELRLVGDFGYLLQKRFGSSFSMDIEVADTTSQVAPLSVQMLVENAVKHNVAAKDRPLKVTIRQEDGYLLITNNLQKKITAEPSTGFGLDGVIQRYALLSDRPVKVEQTEEVFRVWLPLLT